MNCPYCEDPDKHGLLPAEELTYTDLCMWSPENQHRVTSRVHRDKYQAGCHVGITCKEERE